MRRGLTYVLQWIAQAVIQGVRSLIGLAVLMFSVNAASEPQIHLILSEAGGVYEDVAETFQAVGTGRYKTRVWLLDNMSSGDLRQLSGGGDLLVPVGMRAVQGLAGLHSGRAPVLALLVPRLSYEAIHWPSTLSSRHLSAVYIDQPPARSLQLIESAFPHARRIGLVVSEKNASALAPLRQEASRRRLELVLETVKERQQVTNALRRVLPECDVLLVLPDNLVINEASVQSLLLTTYRYRVPVVGFSKGLVGAGAVAAAYSTPDQIARQGAALAAAWNPVSGDVPAARHAGEFSVAFNPRVARSLGVNLPDTRSVSQRLGAELAE